MESLSSSVREAQQMPIRHKPKSTMPVEAPWAPIPPEVLDQFVHQGLRTPEEMDAVLRRFKKAVIERASRAESSDHPRGPAVPGTPGQAAIDRGSTNGMAAVTDDGTMAVSFESRHEDAPAPQRSGKHDRPFIGLDDKIVALYVRGLTVHGIQAFLAEMYAVVVSPDLIGVVTEGAVTDVASWQARPLEPMYPVVFFGALPVKIRDETGVRSKAVYMAVAVLPDGTRDILGLWIDPTENAKTWLNVVTDLKTRGCHDILIAVTDGVSGMSEAIGVVFPETTLQTCIGRLIRHSLAFASWKERRALAAALRPIYTAASADAALTALDEFEPGTWGTRFPTVVAAWRRAWNTVTPAFAFPPEVRRVIYATNVLESVQARCKIVKARGYFQSDAAAATAIWLALRPITAPRAAAYWKSAMNQFAMLYGDRFTKTGV